MGFGAGGGGLRLCGGRLGVRGTAEWAGGFSLQTDASVDVTGRACLKVRDSLPGSSGYVGLAPRKGVAKGSPWFVCWMPLFLR